MFDLKDIIRPHLLDLKPYSSARDEYSGAEGIFLDANENPFGSVVSNSYNRYPDPYQGEVKKYLSEVKNVAPSKIFLGNGSDEAIDLLIRLFCQPAKDQVIICPPTYGMYQVSAQINQVRVKQIPLLAPGFDLDVDTILSDTECKMVFLCSPNNPTGHSFAPDVIIKIINNFKGIVVLDEAYIDFSVQEGLLKKLDRFPNLVILQTFSKAWGLAGLRLGMAFAAEEIIYYLNKIKPPYNINEVTQQLAIEALKNHDQKNRFVTEIIQERKHLTDSLLKIRGVEKIYPTDANFLLVKFKEAKKTYTSLLNHKIIVRDRSNVILCDDCLRITVGTKEENQKLISGLVAISGN